MTLLKELGSRTTISSTGKSDTRKWGLFECPTCQSQIELKLFKGKKNKSCGKAGCRIVDRTSSRTKEEDKLKNLPHYSGFVDFYSRIKDKVDTSWNTIAKFREDMYESYVALKTSGSTVTLFLSDKLPYSKSNCTWVSSGYSTRYDFSKDVKKHTLMLTEELGTTSANVNRAMKKLPNFGSYTYDILGCPGYMNRPYKAYFLTDSQYTRLRDVVLSNIKKQPDNVYLMECEGYHKIGVSSNINARLSALDGSTPFSVSLVYSKKVLDAGSIEKLLHNKYKDTNIKKEWFNLSEYQVKEIVEYLDSI